MNWIIEHINSCKINDSDKCEGCLHVSEANWALLKAKEYMDNKREQEANKPKPIKTQVYNYRLREWRTE